MNKSAHSRSMEIRRNHNELFSQLIPAIETEALSKGRLLLHIPLIVEDISRIPVFFNGWKMYRIDPLKRIWPIGRNFILGHLVSLTTGGVRTLPQCRVYYKCIVEHITKTYDDVWPLYHTTNIYDSYSYSIWESDLCDVLARLLFVCPFPGHHSACSLCKGSERVRQEVFTDEKWKCLYKRDVFCLEAIQYKYCKINTSLSLSSFVGTFRKNTDHSWIYSKTRFSDVRNCLGKIPYPVTLCPWRHTTSGFVAKVKHLYLGSNVYCKHCGDGHLVMNVHNYTFRLGCAKCNLKTLEFEVKKTPHMYGLPARCEYDTPIRKVPLSHANTIYPQIVHEQKYLPAKSSLHTNPCANLMVVYKGEKYLYPFEDYGLLQPYISDSLLVYESFYTTNRPKKFTPRFIVEFMGDADIVCEQVVKQLEMRSLLYTRDYITSGKCVRMGFAFSLSFHDCRRLTMLLCLNIPGIRFTDFYALSNHDRGYIKWNVYHPFSARSSNTLIDNSMFGTRHGQFYICEKVHKTDGVLTKRVVWRSPTDEIVIPQSHYCLLTTTKATPLAKVAWFKTDQCLFLTRRRLLDLELI